MVVVDTIQPLSTATTAALSSNPSQEPDSTTSTQLEHAIAQKVATDFRAREISASAAVLGGCMPDSHFLIDKMVQFAGLYVVRGPTESKHVRYTMDIAIPELQLRGRCIQRFQSFFLLRKRLLEVLKTCRGRLPSRKSTLTGIDDDPSISAGAELVELLTRPRCIQCPECESTFNQLAAVKFPRRTLFPPSLQDVQERSQMLEAFLDTCFLGLDLKAFLANQKDIGVSEVHPVVSVNYQENDQAKDADKSEKTESSSEVVYLPSPHEVGENLEFSDDYEDDRHTEPNFSFISNPSKEDNDEAGMVRSQSHR
ncbi:hypothetical protein PHMEG_0003070 [Phytophthora megakarya]|uniref:PX domain-containing protein n=1 Tax=Phytophthora megakarya TaxID=4795 RepID=A0A225WX77_9STRA|nr:hypothetical protein PHMEG_0003070 [Phytophthora megakarya]